MTPIKRMIREYVQKTGRNPYKFTWKEDYGPYVYRAKDGYTDDFVGFVCEKAVRR